MGLSYHNDEERPYDKDCKVTAEDIHCVLLQGYDILTNCNKSFEERKKELYCLQKQYRCYFDLTYPNFFWFTKDCLGYEFFFLIATVSDFAIDFIAYWDLYGWVVDNQGSCYRRYNFGGCSKLQNSVNKRKVCYTTGCEDKYDMKKREVQNILHEGNFCFNNNIWTDWKCKPGIKICEACSQDCGKTVFKVTVWNWPLGCDGNYAMASIDGKEHQKIVCNDDVVIYDHDKCKRGCHQLTVKLFDQCGKYIGIKDIYSFRVSRKGKVNHRGWVPGKACANGYKGGKGCPKMVNCSSSSGCSSSSSSCPCSSSSSCSSSSVTSVCYQFEKSYSCTSVVCPSSSSSSSCPSSSSSDCCSSSSSGVYVKVKKDCSKTKKFRCKKQCSSSSSSGCSSSSSSSCYAGCGNRRNRH